MQDYQIADIPPPMKEEKPDQAKFVGMYDSRVTEETVSPSGPAAKEGSNGSGKVRTEQENTLKKGADLFDFDEKLFAKSDSLGSASPEDFYPDYQRGSHTYLNVLRFPDVQYFVRLKRIFKLAWNPESALRQAMVTSRIARGNLEVVLGVSVDPSGELAELFLFKSSGVKEYDDEALRTVRASSPFAKPPGKLLAGDNLLRMSWAFTVYF